MAVQRKHVVISGYYGFDNLGDELILQTLIQHLQRKDLEITVLSANPEKTKSRYGVSAVSRLNPLAILNALKKADLLISGGGGLFQDVTGYGSTLYYGGIIRLAKLAGTPVAFWGQGIGPLNTAWGKKLTRWALKQTTLRTVRDDVSARWVESLTGQAVEVTADPVWSLQLPHFNEADKPESFNIGISLRPWQHLTLDGLESLAESCHNLHGSTSQQSFAAFPMAESQDTPVLEQFSQFSQQRGHTLSWIRPSRTLSDIKHCHLLIGMRFHSLILALLAGIPVYGIGYDPKVILLLNQLQLPWTTPETLSQLTAAELNRALSLEVPPDIQALKEKAERNFQLLYPLLNA